MTISIPQTGPASELSIADLINLYGELPAGYVHFLTRHDGVTPPSNIVEGTNYRVGVEVFIPASEIIGQAKAIEGFPKT